MLVRLKQKSQVDRERGKEKWWQEKKLDKDERYNIEINHRSRGAMKTQTDREDKRAFKCKTDGENGGKQKKASEGAYYVAVLLWCDSKLKRLSTHYSSDLGGQLEESSIN